jgi:Membrane dipeptidase (Peptidase family M19)
MIRSLVLSFCFLGATGLIASAQTNSISEQARKLHFSSIVLDTHDDTTQRFSSSDFDLGKRNPTGSIDIPRMREGGMNAIFFSIWIDGRILGPPAIQKALDQIDAVHENVRKYSKDLAFARTADDVRRAHAQGKIAALIGVEGGHMLGNDIRMVPNFQRAWRALHDAVAFLQRRVGGFLHRQAGTQRTHRLRQANRHRDESPGNAG